MRLATRRFRLSASPDEPYEQNRREDDEYEREERPRRAEDGDPVRDNRHRPFSGGDEQAVGHPKVPFLAYPCDAWTLLPRDPSPKSHENEAIVPSGSVEADPSNMTLTPM